MLNQIRSLAICAILTCLVIAGCSDKSAVANNNKQSLRPNVEGKILFESRRDESGKYKLYLLHNKNLAELSSQLGSARWSLDGSAILCHSRTEKREIVVMNEKKDILKTIPVKGRIDENEWFYDGKKIIYSETIRPEGGRIKDDVTHIVIYDLEKDVSSIIFSSEPGYDVLCIILSHDNKKVLFDVSSAIYDKGYIAIMDIDGSNIKIIRNLASSVGWMPDDKWILYTTNIKNDRELYNNEFGCLFTQNIETGEEKVIWNVIPTSLLSERLTSDGKYIYYSRSFPEGGTGIAYSPVEKFGETVVVKPFFINKQVGYSEAGLPDWYIGKEQ